MWSFERVEQNRAIVSVVNEIIASTDLQYVDCVYFGWFTNDAMYDSHDQNKRKLTFEQDKTGYFVPDQKGHRVDVMFGKREPVGEREGFEYSLLAAMYAWDSNAFPGNEYYLGMMSASGDPAAAACSTIPYVQNPRINEEHINGENSGVFFYDPDSKEYEFIKLGKMKFEENKEKWLEKSLKSVPYKRDRFAAGYKGKDAKKGGHSMVDDVKDSGDVDIHEALLNVQPKGLTNGSSPHAVRVVYSNQKKTTVPVLKGTTVLELYAHIKLLSRLRVICTYVLCYMLLC